MSIEKKIMLVTGGCGFIGSNLVDKLLDLGHEVHVWDDMSSESSNTDYVRREAKYIFDDVKLLNSPKYRNTHTKYDVIFHLAAFARIQPSFEHPFEYLQNDIMGTAAVCELARKLGSKVVYAGSSSAYAGPMLNPYAFAKYTGEQVCEMYHKVFGLSTVTARFFNVYGNRQPESGQWATVIGIFERQNRLGNNLTVTGTGEQRRDFTHVSDIVSGFVALSEICGEGQVLNLGTGINYSINEIAYMFGGEKEYLPQRPGEALTTLADISETTRLTGWTPKVALNAYIALDSFNRYVTYK